MSPREVGRGRSTHRGSDDADSRCVPRRIVHSRDEGDKYGNAVIDGIVVEDPELSAATKRLIVTAEEIVDTDEIREDPKATDIPYFFTDAVVEAPYGSHPAEMPNEYYFDEEHMAEWIERSETEEGTQEYIQKYIMETSDFEEYLEVAGGEKKLADLEAIKHYEKEATYIWK